MGSPAKQGGGVPLKKGRIKRKRKEGRKKKEKEEEGERAGQRDTKIIVYNRGYRYGQGQKTLAPKNKCFM